MGVFISERMSDGDGQQGVGIWFVESGLGSLATILFFTGTLWEVRSPTMTIIDHHHRRFPGLVAEDGIGWQVE